MRFPFAFVCCALLSGAIVSGAERFRLVLDAEPLDRAGQVIQFTAPPQPVGSWNLRDSRGASVPLQGRPDGTLVFLVLRQRAGESLTFLLESGDNTFPDAVTTSRDARALQFFANGKPAFHFQLDRSTAPREGVNPALLRAGYLHPVFSPAGHVVTDDYSPKHPHHHGIWTPWTKTFVEGRQTDFWNMHERKGAQHLVTLDRVWSGPVHGGFEARLEQVDLTSGKPVRALDERWSVSLYAIPSDLGVNLFELDLIQTSATDAPVLIGEYQYGGFGLRGAGAWIGPGDAALFQTSNGDSDRISANNTRANWCYLGGRVGEGQSGQAGTVAMGHPTNFRAPQPVRLHPDMPYFSFAPQQLGEFRIETGKPYRARFRFLVLDGQPDRKLIEAYWNGYARPAKPRLERL